MEAIKFNTNWNMKRDEAGVATLQELKSHLDHRLKPIKESTEEDLDRILASFLAYGTFKFQILLKDLPTKDKELVEAVRDCLKGELLLSDGPTKFTWKKSFGVSCLTIQEGNPPHAVTTCARSVIYDDTFREWPLEALRAVNARPIASLTIEKPVTQTHMLLNDDYPARRWLSMDDMEPSQVVDFEKSLDFFEELKDYIVQKNFRHGNPIIYWKDGTFLTGNIDVAALQIDDGVTRKTGKRFKYFLDTKDQWGRKFQRNGGQY